MICKSTLCKAAYGIRKGLMQGNLWVWEVLQTRLEELRQVARPCTSPRMPHTRTDSAETKAWAYWSPP
jgi:hypothetical protein